ncbi:MAG: CapA family protein [Anaerolineae bacterium]|nr:CapA family protein [Anaerolineae bacterium]MDW8300298.1 CapA family protein [Anaerolineae bacterium]
MKLLRLAYRCGIWLLCALVLSGCFARGTRPPMTPTLNALAPGVSPVASPTQFIASPQPTPLTPAVAPTPVAPDIAQQPTPLPPPTQPAPPPSAIRVFIAEGVPPALAAAFTPLIANGQVVLSDAASAQVKLARVAPNTPTPLLARWVYVPVVPFLSTAEQISIPAIQRFWRGDVAALAALSESGQPPVLVMTEEVRRWLVSGLGEPAPNVPTEVVLEEILAPRLWELRNAWSILPFEKLNPTLKALSVNGVNILSRSVSIDQWAMTDTFGVIGADAAALQAVTQAILAAGTWQATNRDPTRLTSLILTGVTALTRATAWKMETQGILYPARDIAPFFAEADILHTSNEVAFAENCPYPNPASTSLRFCSREKYFELLRSIGVNVIELTGNHVNDWGTAALLKTIALYEAHSIPYFGGGKNAADAQRAAVRVHNGNTIAFIGCNAVGPSSAWATAERPGAARCDDAYLSREIPRLKTLADIVVMTIQYQELYQYNAPPAQDAFFRKYAAMGADVVIGSQAHQPQGFAFTAWQGGAFIHFGLGNLFFDQMQSLGTRQMFADKLIIYKGKLLSVQLFTGLIEDYARPRPMTESERIAFLRTIFKASGW